MVNAVAILYLIVGLISFACGFLLLAGGAFFARAANVNPGDRAVIGGIAGVLAFVAILLGIPDLLAAYAIWHRWQWGYVLGLVLAGINCLWAVAGIFWGDPCSVFICGGCGIFAFVVLCDSQYAAEFS